MDLNGLDEADGCLLIGNLMFLRLIASAALLPVFFAPLSGCGTIVAAAKLGNDDKAAFHWVNLERQKAGLRPLSREEWKLQMNSNEVRRSKADFAGVQTKSRVVQGEKKPAYSPAPTPQE